MKKTMLALVLLATSAAVSAQAYTADAPTKQANDPVCKYEDKSYSEGAIRRVDKIALICVERDWGMHVQGAPRVSAAHSVSLARAIPSRFSC